jgi:hypothetical protein
VLELDHVGMAGPEPVGECCPLRLQVEQREAELLHARTVEEEGECVGLRSREELVARLEREALPLDLRELRRQVGDARADQLVLVVDGDARMLGGERPQAAFGAVDARARLAQLLAQKRLGRRVGDEPRLLVGLDVGLCVRSSQEGRQRRARRREGDGHQVGAPHLGDGEVAQIAVDELRRDAARRCEARCCGLGALVALPSARAQHVDQPAAEREQAHALARAREGVTAVEVMRADDALGEVTAA